MKRALFISLALLFCFLVAGAGWYFSKLNTGKSRSIHHSSRTVAAKELMYRLNLHASQLQSYARKHGYNSNTCFLIDMTIESGKNRFFVFDLQKDSIVDAGLVAHGSCNKTFLRGREYGNEPGCGCSSLGKYKIGNAYKGKFGTAYKLYGLDSTNSNAFKRFVVLHSYTCVPDEEVYPLPICQSLGCPMVSPAFMNKLATIIDKSPKPMLLYTFDKK
jgi:hypothetical protein